MKHSKINVRQIQCKSNLTCIIISFLLTLLALPVYSAPYKATVSKTAGLIGMRIHGPDITIVYYNSPAQRAGLRKGDVITKVNFQPFSSEKINGTVGDLIYITVLRTLPEIDAGDAHFDATKIPLTFKVEYIDERLIDRKTNPDQFLGL